MSASSDLRPRAPLPARVPRTPRGLAAGVLILLAAVAVSDLFAAYAGFRIYTVIEGDGGFAFAPQDELDRADALYRTAGHFQPVAFFVCAIVFIVWFHWMRRDAGVFGSPDRFHRGPGWAIGSWFIPFVNFWLPYRIAIDMWGASTRLPADGQPYKVSFWPVNLWWGLFVLTALSNQYAGRRYNNAQSLGDVRDAVFQVLLADLLNIAAAAAAAHFVIRLTTMQRLKAAEGPYGKA